MYWRLNRIQYPVYNLGPGKRIGIWVQGCSIQCKGCINPSLWSTEGGKDVDIEYLVSQILKVQNEFEGITISGGEPFDQYEALIIFCAFIKKKTDLNIYSFSGYTLKHLIEKFPDRLFIKYMDYLLDGPYIEDKHEDENARGSRNQNLYRFLDGKSVLQESLFVSKVWSVNVSKDKEIFMTGIPRKNDLFMVKKAMETSGISMEYI